jgi:uncharacterized protein (TIGR03067 family)
VGGGREFPKELLSGMKLDFNAAGKFRFEFGPEKGSGSYTSDTTKDPAELDYTDDRLRKGNHAIFKIEKDTLTFCFAEGGQARPTAFESPAGTRILLLTFTRVEKKKE